MGVRKKPKDMTIAELSTAIGCEFGGWGMQESAEAALKEMARRLRAAERDSKRRLGIIAKARAAIVAWANDPAGTDPDFLLAEALTAANEELARP